MQGLELDFSWPVAEQYEIISIKKGAGRAAQTIAAGGDPIVALQIVAHGNVTLKRPLAENSSLAVFLIETYRRFGNEPEAALQETALHFASEYGLLSLPSEPGQAEGLDEWLSLMRVILTMKEKLKSEQWGFNAPELDIANIRAGLIRDKLTGAPKLALRPRNLEDAIILQLAQKLARGARILTCSECGAYIEAGIDGKRGDKKFCSDKCRNHFHNRQKRQAT